MSDFIDPYEHLPKSELLNTTIEVSQRDFAFLKGLFPHRSVLQTTINILLSRFIRECKKHGLREYNPIALRNAVTSATIAIDLRGSVVNAPSSTNTNQPIQADCRDDGQGTGSVGDLNPRLPVTAPNADVTPKTRKRVKKGEETKGTGAGV